MQGASQRSPGWANLQPELLLQVAGLLGNEDRLSQMHTCGRWYAAIAAGPPHLVPAAVLAYSSLDIEGLPGRRLRDVASKIQQAYAEGASQALSLVLQASQLPPQTWRVRIEGEAQPNAALAMLPVLPAGVRWLDLAVAPYAGPLLRALTRFTRLQRLTITGNGAGIDWDAGPSAVLALLQHLCLDYRREPFYEPDGTVQHTLVDQVPPCVRHALAAATSLHTLELRLEWSAEVAALCGALPELRCLSLHLYECTNEHCAAPEQLLRELPHLSALSLGVYSCHGSEKDNDYPAIEGWDLVLAPPPLASVNALSALHLAGVVQLPPDFRQLAQLQRLAVIGGVSDEGESLEWGAAPLSGLTSLTRVELRQGDQKIDLPDPAVLASVPCLSEVHAPYHQWYSHLRERLDAWRAQLAALRPEVRITP